MTRQGNCHNAASSNKSTLATLSQGTVLWAEQRLRKANQGVRRRKRQFFVNWTQRLRSLCHEYPSAAKSGEKSRNRLLKSFHMQRGCSSSTGFPARTQNVLTTFPPFRPCLQALKSSQSGSLGSSSLWDATGSPSPFSPICFTVKLLTATHKGNGPF